MSNIQTLIEYLNPRKHKASSNGTEEYHFIRIDNDFLDANQDTASVNITKVIKKKLDDPLSSAFTRMNISSILYVEESNNKINYYFQKEIDGVIKYLTLENLLNYNSTNNFFEELDDNDFMKIEAQETLYYHEIQEAIYLRITQTAEIIIVSKRTLYYNPKELGGLKNGEHKINYKDATGYTYEILDRFLTSYFEQKKRNVKVTLNPQEGNLYWYPEVTISGSNKITLFYDYHTRENDDFNVDPLKEEYAIKLIFEDVEGFLGFIMATYFINGISPLQVIGDIDTRKDIFFENYVNIINKLLRKSRINIDKALTYLFYIPADFFIKKQNLFLKMKDPDNILGASFIWDTIGLALKDPLTNFGLNKEDIVLRLLKILKYIQQDEDGNIKEKNDYILNQLLSKKTEDKVSYLQALYSKLNTDNFVAYNAYIYNLWRNSSFTNPANEVFTKTSQLVNPENQNTPRIILPYKTNKLLGFYSSNMNLVFNKEGNIVVTPDKQSIENVLKVITPGLGELVEAFIEEDWQAVYHPLQPVYLAEPNNDKAVRLQGLSPMLLLKANEDKSFWSNLGTTAEYAVDAITTLSGVGNLYKFRQLARIVKTVESLNKSNKVIRGYTIYKSVKGLAAGSEITSGTINILLKLTGIGETELGKTISELLFWLELASLSGEITFATKNGIKSTAKKIFKKETEFEKILEKKVNDPDLKKRISRVSKYKALKELREIAEIDIDGPLKDFLLFRVKFAHKVSKTNKLWKAKSFVKITEAEIVELFSKHLDDFPGLVKGHNQADFNIQFIENGKLIDAVEEFSLSGRKDNIFDRFGNPPKLPVNTVDVFENYDEFSTFVTGAYDLTGKARKFDSEIKFVYNFLKNHIHKADEFVIETSNIFATCTSCQREFVMLEEYAKTLNKKIKFVIKTDHKVKGFADLKDEYPSIKELIKKYTKEYNKSKKKK